MKNKTVGLIIIGIALLIGFIVYSFNRALTEIASASCTHGTTCPMWGTISFQTNLGLRLMGLVVLAGLYIIFFMRDRPKIGGQTEKPKINKESYGEMMKEMSEEEKKVFERVLDNEGAVFQSELVEETGLDKVKVSRILDKLEGRGLIERRRRGMTNVVILRH